MRTPLATLALLTLLAGPPALAQQERQPTLPQAGGDAAAAAIQAQPIPGPTRAENQAGQQNPAAHTASGCGATDAQLADTPPLSNPCPGTFPTPGSGQAK